MATATGTKPSVAELVEAALREGEPVALQLLREQVPCSASTLTKTLSKLVADGVIERPARGVYRLAQVSEPALIPAQRDGVELEREPEAAVPAARHAEVYIPLQAARATVVEREPEVAAAVIADPVEFHSAEAAPEPAPEPEPVLAQEPEPIHFEPPPVVVVERAPIRWDTGAIPVRDRRFVVRASLILLWAFLTGFALVIGGGTVGVIVSAGVLVAAVVVDRFLRSYYKGGVIPPIGRRDRFA